MTKAIISIRRFSVGLVCFLFALAACAGPDDDAAAKAGVKAPQAPAWAPAVPPRIHIVHGLWDSQYRIEEAIARCGSAVLADSWHAAAGGFGFTCLWNDGAVGSVGDFPGAFSGRISIFDYPLVVIAHVNATAFTPADRVRLRDYVRTGGAVLILGGRFDTGGQYLNTAIEELAPVQFQSGLDFEHPEGGVVLQRSDDDLARGWSSLAWDRQPRVYWYHRTTPKPGARVLLTLNDRPALTAGTFGKGRVVIFSSTVMGDPAKDQTAFWQWDGWPVILADTIRWLMQASAAARTAVNNATALATVEQMVDAGAVVEAIEKRSAAKAGPNYWTPVYDAARSASDAQSVNTLIKVLAELPGDVPADLVEFMLARLPPHADAACGANATLLTKSSLPGKTALGLGLLGAAKAPGAFAILANAYNNPEIQSAAPAVSAESETVLDARNLASMATPESDQLAQLVRRAAAIGMGWLGSPEAAERLQQIRQDTAGAMPDPRQFTELKPELQLHEQALLALARCGEATVAGELIDLLIENRYIIVRQRIHETPISATKAKAAKEHLSVILNWQQTLLEQLATLPASARTALAVRLAKEADPAVISVALAAFAGPPAPSDNARTILKASLLPAVRALGATGGQ